MLNKSHLAPGLYVISDVHDTDSDGRVRWGKKPPLRENWSSTHNFCSRTVIESFLESLFHVQAMVCIISIYLVSKYAKIEFENKT